MAASFQIKHDVFISFRGPDIRSSFLSHLSTALHRKGIDAYVDEKLDRGDELSPAIFKAIEESQISLVIFSKDYASSKWCLKELVEIMKCRERNRQIVVPVFYNTDPSDVKHQKGSYEDAFAEHEKSMKDMAQVQKWRTALEKAANLLGFHSSNFLTEAELIEKIVKHVLKRLDDVYQTDFKGLIGINKPIAQLELLMCNGSMDVRVIGIWGMGGIGKTTIATALYNKLCFEFESCCFLANIREESKRYGIVHLKNKLFSILLEEDLHIGMSDGVPTNAMRRLLRKKVLIVLDDINDSEQLENLAGAHDWFGSGSRIIVTTRDKHLVRKDADAVYEVEAMNFNEALQLFKLNAFKSNCLDMELIKLSRRVVKYAKGLPLALKVLGSFLYGKSKKEWESQLEKLKKMPCAKIHEVLRLSYDGLDHQEKNIFLYIACFFKGYQQRQIIVLLDACGFSTTIGLKVLQDKALITEIEDWASEVSIVSMHDVIQEMGKEIVRKESMEDSGKRSRLWDPNDICEVLTNGTGTEAIQSIILDMSKIEELFLNSQVFARMQKLKFLKFSNDVYRGRRVVHLPQGLGFLPSELRLLHWNCYPLKSLPLNFCAKSLVELNMTWSRVEKLWDGVVPLVNLKKIDLSYSKYLLELSDFSMANNLEEVSLSNCRQLHLVHPSILSLHKLVKLNLSCCIKLTHLQSDVHLKSLRDLFLRGCSRLEEFSVTSENMRVLDLSGTAIKELPLSIGCLSKLEYFNLDNCKCLMHLPSNLVDLRSLRHLRITGCIQLRSLACLPPSIEELRATNCASLETLFLTSMAADPLNRNMISVWLENCMNLDEQVLNVIGSNAHLNLTNYAFKQISLEEREMQMFDIQPQVTYPGSKVPEWFKYRTKQASITIAPYTKLQGFIFCVIIRQPRLSNYDKFIAFDCFLEDYNGGKIPIGEIYDSCLTSDVHVAELDSDHVCIWYHERYCIWINQMIQESRDRNQHTTYNPKISFEFFAPISIYWGKREGVIKECGVHPIYASENNNFIEEMELGKKKLKRCRDIDELEPTSENRVKGSKPCWNLEARDGRDRKLLIRCCFVVFQHSKET